MTVAREDAIRPVVSGLAERWLTGEVPARDYFSQARRIARERASSTMLGRIRRLVFARAG